MGKQDNELVKLLDKFAYANTRHDNGDHNHIKISLTNLNDLADIDLTGKPLEEAKNYVVNLLSSKIHNYVKIKYKPSIGSTILASAMIRNMADRINYRQEFELVYQGSSLEICNASYELKNTYIDDFQKNLPITIRV